MEVSEICQTIPAPLFGARLAAGTKFILIRVTFLIPLQSTHQHPSPSNVSPNPQEVIWVSPKLSDFKREKLLLDKIQQLCKDSWEDPVAGITWGPREIRNRWVWNKKKWTNECGKLSAWGWLRQILFGFRISNEKRQSVSFVRSYFLFCFVLFCSWANTTGRRVTIGRLKSWVSIKYSAYFQWQPIPSKEIWAPKIRKHLTLSLQVRPFRTNDTFELSKMIMRFKDQTCWILSFLLSKNWLTPGQVIQYSD